MTTDPLTLREARARYFEENQFGADGGYGSKWVPVKVGPLRLRIPNTPARVSAVRFHDLHHLVTGYRTDFHGEAEIAAWELASGCRSFWAAWGLNLSGLGVGLFRWPGDLFRAYVRGRHSRNLYGETFDDALLSRTVAQVRAELRVDGGFTSTVADAAGFGAMALLGVALMGVTLAVIFAPVVAVCWALVHWLR